MFAKAMHTLKLILATLMGAIFLFLAGCSPAQKHPNQINSFDGATYDSLTAAHGALVSFRSTVSTKYPQYTNTFNQAAAAYSVAYNAYAAYRSTPSNTAAVTVALSNLTVSIIALENTMQTDLHVSPQTVAGIRGRAAHIRAAAQPRISISDVLSELEVAAAIAETIPGAQPYAGLAAIVIEATQEAVSALQSSAGQAIDLSTIQPVLAL